MNCNIRRTADPRSGHYRINGKGQTAYESFVPMPLQDVELRYDDETRRLADVALAHIRQKDTEGKNMAEEAVKSSIRLAWNVPPLFLMTSDKVMEEKSSIDRSNLRNALEYGLEHLDTLPLSGRMLKDLHWIAMQGELGEKKYPGEFRSSPIWIGGEDDTLATAPFVPPSPDDMLTAFYDLENYIHADDRVHPLVKAALIHYQFEVIHPFLDGNGRIGRLLTGLYLVARGVLNGCTVNLSGVLHRRQFQYFTRLATVEVSGDYEKWVRFFLSALAEA